MGRAVAPAAARPTRVRSAGPPVGCWPPRGGSRSECRGFCARGRCRSHLVRRPARRARSGRHRARRAANDLRTGHCERQGRSTRRAGRRHRVAAVGPRSFEPVEGRIALGAPSRPRISGPAVAAGADSPGAAAAPLGAAASGPGKGRRRACDPAPPFGPGRSSRYPLTDWRRSDSGHRWCRCSDDEPAAAIDLRAASTRPRFPPAPPGSGVS